MTSLLFLIISLTHFSTVYTQLDTTVCTPGSSDNKGPPVPLLPERFTLRVEANLLNKNSTIDVHEWHDGPGNRGAAITWLSSVQFSYIYSYPTNQQFSFEQITGGRYDCQVQQLNSLSEPYLHGTDSTTTTTNTTTHIYSAARALSFAGGLAERYEGRSDVRGIVADTWSSCVFWPDRNATMSVFWYFTVTQGWDTALGMSQVPVRCQVRGRVHSGGRARTFEHLYEVSEFYDYLDGGLQVFETPAGTVCPGRKNSKAVPSLPPRFSYSAEVVDVEAQTSQFIKKGYDSQLKLGMMELVSAVKPYTKIRIIDDFNTGASYTVDRQRGNCTMATIDPVGFDALHTNTGLRMRTAHEFFFDQETDYSYEGIRSLRQLNTDVWVGKKWWPPNNPSNSTWEYYFVTPEWQENAGLTSASKMPVSIHVTLGRQQVHQIYNLYDFRDDDPRIWEYDITSCFDQNHNFRVLSLYFPVTVTQLQVVSTNQDTFRRALLNSVTSLVPLSPVRLNNIQLEFRQGGIGVQMVIVEAAVLASPVVTSPLQELPLVTLMTRLQEAVTLGQLVVTLNTPGTSVSLVATTPPTTPTLATPPVTASQAPPLHPALSAGGKTRASVVVCIPHSSGYTPGDVAGVTLGSTLGCYVAVLVAVSLWTRWKGGTPLYQRDRLEMS
ncbi:uncharacterized protein [Littorina saxatilis]|uniref:Uncharacterized protein n=1 Tax=Littorina saxatilis TaxID=31220 RepID=A0AAN9G5P1_9CAEN